MADEWNLNVPTNEELISDLPEEHRERKTNVKAVIEVEHTTLGDGNSGGLHKPGSARAFFQDAAPTTNIDGSDFGAGDLGLLWIDSNADPDNQFNILTATTPTWTPISTEIIAVLLASNRTFAGTLTVTGIATIADKSKNATSAAPDADVQLTNKKYVDDNEAATKYSINPMTGADDSTGTITFPNGLIWKWGKDTTEGASTDITFATAFPNACFEVIACSGGATQDSYNMQPNTITKTSFNVVFYAGLNRIFRWFAIGR